MAHVKISQLIVTAGVAVAGLIGFAGAAHAAPPVGGTTLACVNDGTALAVAIDPETFQVIDVPAGESQVVSTNGGQIVVAQDTCETPVCAEGAIATVVDDSGVQQQACVASAAAVPPAPAAAATFAPPAPTPSTPTTPLPSTPAATKALPKTGASAESLIIAALLVGSGSVVSLVARRRS